MNMKKIKKFFTLARRHDGFTLVELIVVIAILAILGGVAVPAYGGYVKKANMQADMTLISEIEHALTLAGYSGTFNGEPSGYIILSSDGELKGVAEESALENAMIAAFGANYKDVLKLKYDKWGSNGVFDNLTNHTAYAVNESNYLNGGRSENLLKDVEILTGMAKDCVTVLGSSLQGATLNTLFGADVLNATGTKYGIGEDDWTVEDWDAWASKNETEYSNLLVLAAADEAEKTLSDENYEMSEASELILSFSSYYAYASIDNTFSDTLDTYLGHLNGTETVPGLEPIDSAASGAAWFSSLQDAANKAGYSSYATGAERLPDSIAFMSILAGIGNPSEEQASRIALDLDNPNLFTNGIVNGMYNEYIDAVRAMAPFYDEENEFGLGISEGNVAIIFLLKDGKPVILNSMPD